jgi:hypothetical protein
MCKPVRPFRAKVSGKPFAQLPRQRRCLPAGRYRQQQIPATNDGRDMKVAELRHILYIKKNT